MMFMKTILALSLAALVLAVPVPQPSKGKGRRPKPVAVNIGTFCLSQYALFTSLIIKRGWTCR